MWGTNGIFFLECYDQNGLPLALSPYQINQMSPRCNFLLEYFSRGFDCCDLIPLCVCC